MATLDDVARMAGELPEAAEGERHGNRTWFIGGKAFALREAMNDGWLACAPPALAQAHLNRG